MHSNKVTQTVAPTSAILTPAEVKLHLNITHDDEDALIVRLIDAATAMIDGPTGIGRAMITQTYRLSLDHLPRLLSLPVNPVRSVTGIVINGHPLDAELYSLNVDIDPATVFSSFTACFTDPSAVKVTFVAGYGDDASDVPADLRQAALLIIGHLYENRSEVGDTKAVLPMGAQTILNRYR